MLSFGATIQMVAAEHYFLVELLILLYKPEVLLTLEFVEGILWCYQTVLACTVVHGYMYCVFSERRDSKLRLCG